MPSVRTILGDVEAVDLGVTYFHEHLIAQPPRHFAGWEDDLVLDDVEAAARELAAFTGAGGACIVDASAVDYGRDARALGEVARRSGCRVVATAGFNKSAYFTSDIERAGLAELEDRVARDVEVGIDGSPYRAGILKFGTSLARMTDAEERAARAVCRVQRATGLPLYTHTEAGTFAMEQLDLIGAEGVDAAHVCIGHLDRRRDAGYLLDVARRGTYIGIDQVGKTKYCTDEERMDQIIALVEAGFGTRVLISGDMARRSYLTAYGGGPGLAHIVRAFVPRLVERLLDRGMEAEEAAGVGRRLLVDNPARYLAMQEVT